MTFASIGLLPVPGQWRWPAGMSGMSFGSPGGEGRLFFAVDGAPWACSARDCPARPGRRRHHRCAPRRAGARPASPACPLPESRLRIAAVRLLSESMRNCADTTIVSPAAMPSSTSHTPSPYRAEGDGGDLERAGRPLEDYQIAGAAADHGRLRNHQRVARHRHVELSRWRTSPPAASGRGSPARWRRSSCASVHRSADTGSGRIPCRGVRGR